MWSPDSHMTSAFSPPHTSWNDHLVGRAKNSWEKESELSALEIKTEVKKGYQKSPSKSLPWTCKILCFPGRS